MVACVCAFFFIRWKKAATLVISHFALAEVQD